MIPLVVMAVLSCHPHHAVKHHVATDAPATFKQRWRNDFPKYKLVVVKQK
jgi:hypothetical protein